MKTKFKIYVEYDGGLDPDLDQRIMRAVGYEFDNDGPVLSSDSGCMLVGACTRDQTFYLNDEAAVFVAEQELRRVGGIRFRIEEREGDEKWRLLAI